MGEENVQVLVVDDDERLRRLVRTTFEGFDIAVSEAQDTDEALDEIRLSRPDVIVLDVMLPGTDGVAFCRSLKSNPETRDIAIVLLTGSAGVERVAQDAGGADAFVKKPFSPLELLSVAERLAGRRYGVPMRGPRAPGAPEEQLLLYARDLRHVLEVERSHRRLLERAYHDTVAALASALESKDTGTRAHSERVQRYALELARAIATDPTDDPSIGYGFLLHDVGKIGIPDRILLKPGPLTRSEWRLMQTHTVLGEQMLGEVAFLQGEGLKVVRSHHERWDGRGYPDGLRGDEIPAGARIFALADTLDAMTSHRPYRRARAWAAARAEILATSGAQFDPQVVEAFQVCESALRRIRREFAGTNGATAAGELAAFSTTGLGL
jgi:response regulator RpfG family c-di-GMP phosphodiesterase